MRFQCPSTDVWRCKTTLTKLWQGHEQQVGMMKKSWSLSVIVLHVLKSNKYGNNYCGKLVRNKRGDYIN